MSNSLEPHGLKPAGSSVHCDSPGKNTIVGCHAMFQRIFPTQESSSGLPHCRRILYHLSHEGSPCLWTPSSTLNQFTHHFLIRVSADQPDQLSEFFLPPQTATLNAESPLIIAFQLLSHVWLFATPWTAACQVSLSFTIFQSLLDSCLLSQWCLSTISSCHPLLLLPSVFPSIRVFSNELVLCIKWPKYWSFSFRISPSNEYWRLISFKIDWSPYCPRDSQESSPTLWRNCNIKCRICT